MHKQNNISIEDVPLNQFHKKLTLFSAGGPFLDGYVLSIIGIVMAQISSALHLNSVWEGLIAAAALIGIFFGGFLGGWFTDRFGRKVLYLIDLIAIIGFSVAQFWVESALALFVLRLLLGIAVGADYPIATAFLAEFLPLKYRGPLLASLLVMWFAGAACAYIAGSIIMQVVAGPDAWRYVLASAALPGALFLFARAGIPESPRWLIGKGYCEEAEKVIKQVYGPEFSLMNLTETVKAKQVSVWALFHSGYGRRMCFITISWTCAIVPLFAIYSFAPIVLGALKLNEKDVILGSITIMLMFVVGSLLTMKLVNVMGRRSMMIHSFFWSAIPLMVLGLYSNAPATLVLVLFCAYAIINSGTQVLPFIYPNELFPTEIRASAMGLGTSLSRIGAVIGTYMVPMSLSSLGIGNTMLVAAAITFLGAWCGWTMAPETNTLDLHQASSLMKH